MKIVQINATYGYGSTGHIVRDLHKMLQEKGHSSFVFWATRCTQEGSADSHIFQVGSWLDHKRHAVLRRIKNNQGWNSHGATRRLCKKLGELQPDIVHLHNLHSNFIHLPTLLKYLGEAKLATVLTLHDCWFFTGHCMHFTGHGACGQWKKESCENCPAVKPRMQSQVNRQFLEKKALFGGIDRLGVIGVSQWISDCGKASLLKGAAISRKIYNWVDGETFRPQEAGDKIREKYGIPQGKKIILGVSQGWSPQKGLEEFRLLSRALKEQAVVLLAGGCEGLQSTESLKFVGFTNDQRELAELYAAADVFVNPSRMETFGKVTAEALSCGTPVVCYDNTAISELVTEGTGILVPDGDEKKLLAGVQELLSRGKEAYTRPCRAFAAEHFEKESLLQDHLQMYSAILRK